MSVIISVISDITFSISLSVYLVYFLISLLDLSQLYDFRIESEAIFPDKKGPKLQTNKKVL